MTNKTDPVLRERQERFTQLLEPIHSRLLRFCRAITNDRDTARDMASEAILIAYRNFDGITEPEKLRSYLFTTASNLARRERGRKSRFATSEEAHDISGGVSPEMAAEVSLLQDALWKLPEKLRETIVLFEVSGFSIEEIAALQNSGSSAVKMRLARGRRQLKKLLGIREEAKPELALKGVW